MIKSSCKQKKNRLQSCPKQSQLSIEEASGTGEGWQSRKIFWKSRLLISLKQAHELSRWEREGRESLAEEATGAKVLRLVRGRK